MNDWMMNPWTQMGLGILAANRPGASTGQAIGQGLLGGMQNMQRLEDWQAQKQERDQRLAMQEKVGQMYPGIAPVLAAYPNAAPHVLAARFPKPGGYGGTPIHVQDKQTGQVKVAQLADNGGAFIFNPDGSSERVDFNRYQVIKPYASADFGGSLGAFQPMTGSYSGAGQGMTYSDATGNSFVAPQGIIEDGEVLSPDSQYRPAGMGVPKTLEPAQRPEVKGAQTRATAAATAAVEKTTNMPKVRASLNTFERQTNIARQNIKDIIGLYGPMTAWTPDFIAAMPLSKVRAIQNKLQTIKSNIGFQALQEMRANSPTGGALGQVAVQELEGLQATLGAMDWRDSEFIPTLLRIDEILSGMKSTARDAFETDYGLKKSDPLGIR